MSVSSSNHARGILGPLTERIALPTCSELVIRVSPQQTAIDIANDAGITTSCYPQGLIRDHLYSPGVCPSAWTSAHAVTNGESLLSYSLLASDTGVMCCPERFTWQGGIEYCVSSTTLSSGEAIVGFQYNQTTLTSIIVTTDDALFFFEAQAILVAYQATDTAIAQFFAGNTAAFSKISSTSAAPSSTFGVASVTSAPAGSTGSPVSKPAPATGSSGLSTGAKIGIGVAVPLVAIIVGLSIWLFLVYRQKHRSEQLRASNRPETVGAPARSDLTAWNSQNYTQPVIRASSANKTESGWDHGLSSRPPVVEDRVEPSAMLNMEQRPISPIYGFEPLEAPRRPL